MRKKLDRTIIIPIRILNGKVIFKYGGALPSLKENAIGELKIKENDVKDKEFVAIMQECRRILLFDEETVLWIAVSEKRVPYRWLDETESLNCSELNGYRFVKIILKDKLNLKTRGTKSAVLEDVECYIPALKEVAKSINHASTIISKVFEPDRKSNVNNAFELCVYKDKHNWKPLKNLRDYIMIKLEDNLKSR